MTTLRERLDDYLAMRRALGFQLSDIERQVGLFCSWLEARGQTQTFPIDDAVTWARLNPDAHPSWWATRLSLVRRFAAHLNAEGADVPVIPAGLLPARKPRAVPFIYSQDDVDALLAACDDEFTHELVSASVRSRTFRHASKRHKQIYHKGHQVAVKMSGKPVKRTLNQLLPFQG